ncbi:low molecular weight phosphatase family protein [Nitratireductor arenosus]
MLFVCGMNAIRSPMAESIARSLLPANVFLASAGVRAGARDPFVDAVLAEDGMAPLERAPRMLDDLEDDYFDLIVTLAPEAHHAALELTRALSVEVEYWPTPDPSIVSGTREQILAAYREVRDRLSARIRGRFGLDASTQ